MKSALKILVTPTENEFKNYLRIFLLAGIISVIIFLPFLIFYKGVFLLYGDYNVQQIPFYQLAHDAVRKGDFGWNWKTDLGANFIASYSFYLLGSPFFLADNSLSKRILAIFNDAASYFKNFNRSFDFIRVHQALC